MALLVESASDLEKVPASGVTFKVPGFDAASSESSSIGVPSDDDDSGSDDEVQRTLLLDDLERSLPSPLQVSKIIKHLKVYQHSNRGKE